MVKLCHTAIRKPLELISGSCLESGNFFLESKIANVVPAHEKRDKQILKSTAPYLSFSFTEKYLKENCRIC